MTTYEHLCNHCNQEFEAVYGMKEPVPTKCPLCEKEGGVKRLISGGSGKGSVELTGRELTEKLMADGAKIKNDSYKSEKIYANLLGEDRYQSIQSRMDRRPKPERPRFTSKKSWIVSEAKLIRVLKTLLQINNPEVIRCTIESLIEELEDGKRQKKMKKE